MEGVGSSDPTEIPLVAVNFQTNCQRHFSDAFARPSCNQASDHPVQQGKPWTPNTFSDHLSDHYSDASSVTRRLFLCALTCSLVHHPRVCPTLLLWRRIIRLLWCVYPTWLIRIIRPYWVLQNSSNSAFLWVLSSCFALLWLFTLFLGPDEIHLTNTLVPLIALSPDHQNHSKWLKWGHVHYRCAC